MSGRNSSSSQRNDDARTHTHSLSVSCVPWSFVRAILLPACIFINRSKRSIDRSTATDARVYGQDQVGHVPAVGLWDVLLGHVTLGSRIADNPRLTAAYVRRLIIIVIMATWAFFIVSLLRRERKTSRRPLFLIFDVCLEVDDTRFWGWKLIWQKCNWVRSLGEKMNRVDDDNNNNNHHRNMGIFIANAMTHELLFLIFVLRLGGWRCAS